MLAVPVVLIDDHDTSRLKIGARAVLVVAHDNNHIY